MLSLLGIAAALTVEWPQFVRVLIVAALMLFAAVCIWAFRRQQSGSFVITEDGFELSDRDAPGEAIPWERVGRLRTNNYGELLFCSPNDDVLGQVPLQMLDDETVKFILTKTQPSSAQLPVTFARTTSIRWVDAACFIALGGIGVGALAEDTSIGIAVLVLVVVLWFLTERSSRVIIDAQAMSLYGITGERRISWSEVSGIEVSRKWTIEHGSKYGKHGPPPPHVEVIVRGQRIPISPTGADWLSIWSAATFALSEYRRAHPNVK